VRERVILLVKVRGSSIGTVVTEGRERESHVSLAYVEVWFLIPPTPVVVLNNDILQLCHVL
jgi:hypothetical protein